MEYIARQLLNAYLLQIVDLLLKYGADPLLKCDRGKTPMDMITDRSMYIVVEKYLQKTKSNPFTGINLSLHKTLTLSHKTLQM